MPGVVGQYVETIEQSKAEETVARFTGEHYEGIAADLYDRMRNEREFIPNISVGEAYQRAAERLINDIQTYDKAVSESEFQSEARSLREGIHIDQFHARYESPGETASEYQQNLHADESLDFVEKQLQAVDRQFPDATEVEKLQMTESKLGLDHSQSERLIIDYGRYTERENESPHIPLSAEENKQIRRLTETAGLSFPEARERLQNQLSEIRNDPDPDMRMGHKQQVRQAVAEIRGSLEREKESPRESIRMRIG